MLTGVQGGAVGATPRTVGELRKIRSPPIRRRLLRSSPRAGLGAACGLARPTRPAWTGCSAHRSNKGGCRTSRLNWTPNPPAIHEVTQARPQALLAEAYRGSRDRGGRLWQLAARAGEVSYANLRGRVGAGGRGRRLVPACGTALAAVALGSVRVARAAWSSLLNWLSSNSRRPDIARS